MTLMTLIHQNSKAILTKALVTSRGDTTLRVTFEDLGHVHLD